MKLLHRQGITLIEVLIAIYIFGIGILVVLRMLISNISWLYDIRAKDTAVSLAKEGMDIVYNLRDSNIKKGMNRDCVSISYNPSLNSWSCTQLLLTGALSLYTVNFSLTGMYSLQSIDSTGSVDAQLRYHTGTWFVTSGVVNTGFWYDHIALGGQLTQFSRWIEIFPQQNYPTHIDRILGVRSMVEYRRGTTTKRVVLESIIGDMR